MSAAGRGFGAVVLAAGAGRRFGGGKLLAEFAGEPLLAHALRAAAAAPVAEVVVVAAPGLPIPDIGPVPTRRVLRLASNGLAASLQAGIAALAERDGVFVFLGDMPLVPTGIAARLAALLGDGFAALPRCEGRPGHPVLLARRAFAEAMTLAGDTGMGALLRGRPDVAWLDIEDRGVLLDVDRREDLAALTKLGSG